MTAISALLASGCAGGRRSIARIDRLSMRTASCATAPASSTVTPAFSSRAVALAAQHARSCVQSTRAPVIWPAISPQPMPIWSNDTWARRSRGCSRNSSSSSGWSLRLRGPNGARDAFPPRRYRPKPPQDGKADPDANHSSPRISGGEASVPRSNWRQRQYQRWVFQHNRVAFCHPSLTLYFVSSSGFFARFDTGSLKIRK
jgi:hypothetical protein